MPAPLTSTILGAGLVFVIAGVAGLSGAALIGVILAVLALVCEIGLTVIAASE